MVIMIHRIRASIPGSFVCSIAMVALVTGCRSAPAPSSGPEAEVVVDREAVLEHTRVLASTEFEGRAPGTRGEELTVAYVAEQFRKAGLEPAGADGSWFQPVPLVGITGTLTPLTFSKGSTRTVLQPKEDFVAWSKREVDVNRLESSELVFVGYGVVAPEADWDDYKGIDLSGKTMVVLVGDPPVPDPDDPSRLDPRTFAGEAMTYYGRWPYKFEMGAEKKAAGVLIVHETGPAGYDCSVV
jgi:hypothetical protein